MSAQTPKLKKEVKIMKLTKNAAPARRDYFLGAYTAERIIQRAIDRAGSPLDVIHVPTPYGTYSFIAGARSASEVVERMCKRFDSPAMSVANWLKDWNRKPLEY